MDNLFLQLETGQLLRILPISEDNIYEKFMFNYLKAREEFFIHEDNNFIPFGMYSQLHHRTERFFTVVDNGNELYIIKFGRKIKTMLDDYSSEDHLIPIDFILDNISLDVVVNMISITGGTVGNFDKCVVSRVICGANDYKSKDDYFLSDQYKSLMVLYNNYITKMRIENKPETLKTIIRLYPFLVFVLAYKQFFSFKSLMTFFLASNLSRPL